MSDPKAVTAIPWMEAAASVEEAAEGMARRRELRAANLSPKRPDEGELKALDSSMKRNTALLRKLRQLGEDTRASLLEEVAKVNQSKYVAEAVAAVAEAPLKLRDMPAALALCAALHQRYPEFGSEVVAALARVAVAGPGEDGERASLGRKRATLRLLVELLLGGVCTAHGPLLAIVRALAGVDFGREGEAAQASLSLLATFAKAGREEVLGLTPALPAVLPPELPAGGAEEAVRRYAAAVARYESELAVRHVLPAAVQAQFLGQVERCFDAACAALVAAHEALQATEATNARILNNRGELPEELSAAYEAQRRSFEGLQRNSASLAEVLDRPLPELSEGATRVAAAAEEAAPSEAKDGQPQPVFEDEEARAFYETLVDLRAVVPAVLLGEAKAAPREGGDAAQQQPADGVAEAGSGAATSAAALAEQVAGLAVSDVGPSLMPSPEKPTAAAAAAAAAAAGEAGPSKVDDKEDGSSEKREQLELVLSRLPGCVSKELCDEASVNFCYAQSGRGARRRLVRALSDIPYGALQLLPYYARVAATLAQVFPDVTVGLASNLESEFEELQRRKDATGRTLEPRIRNMRYVAELVKFKALPPGTAFSMLKALLDDFTGHNIDAACALVESAGRYLYRLPETSTRMANMAEVMMKLRAARNLDARQSGLVEGAVVAAKASATVAKRGKVRPPLREYVRLLVYDRLARGEVTKVMRRLRRLPWAESEPYLLRTLLRSAYKGRFSQIPFIASLAAGLQRYHPSIGVGIVDAALEEVAAGLETPDAGLYQRRVAMVRLVGELYCYKLLNSTTLFATLHRLLAYGYDAATPPEAARRLDPPSNFFRIRLVATLLDACGQYFTRGTARKRLEAYLPYLQRYVLAKPALPLDVEFDLADLFAKLKVAPPKYASYEEACRGVEDVEARAAAAAAVGLSAVEEEEEEEEEEEDDEEGGASDDGASLVSEDEGGSQGEDEDEDESGGSGSESEEEQVRVLRGAGPTAPVEVDEEFERQLAQLLTDHQGPRQAARPAAGGAAAAAAAAADAGPSDGGEVGGSSTVAFKVMMRRGGKEDKTREVQIPMTSGMAIHLRAKGEREAAERAEMKRLVLQADARSSAEEAAELRAHLAQQATRRRYSRGAA